MQPSNDLASPKSSLNDPMDPISSFSPADDDNLKKILIDGKSWSFKALKKGSFRTYRCPNRIISQCEAYMHLHERQLQKIIKNDANEPQDSITYELVRPHTCQTKVQTELSKLSTKGEMNQTVREEILKNPLAPFSVHKANVQKLSIPFNDYTLKNVIHQIKQEIYPKDDEFFAQFPTCKVQFSDNIHQMFFRHT